MNTVWIVVGLGIAGGFIALIASWHRRGQQAELGSVSHQWLAEQRLGQAHDPQR